jgi:predicted PP-loop superfamily ATPase
MILKKIFGILKSWVGLFTSFVAIGMFNIRLRALYLRFLGFTGNIGLKLFPSIYKSLDAQNKKYGSGRRIKESYQAKEDFNNFLIEAEKTNLTKEQIYSKLTNNGGIKSTILSMTLDQIFDNANRDIEVGVQYSGGCDSTLAAMLAARYFKKVHLLNFYHPFIKQKERSEFNANKMISMFGKEKVKYTRIDTTDTFNRILFGNYLGDLIKFKTFVVGVGCLACKISFDVHIIKYAMEHNIKLVLDGADLSVKSQLSQGDEGILKARHEFYSEHRIEFKHPAARFENNPHEMFVLGMEANPPQIMYAEQPECIGNQFLNEIYDRFYFLPKYGIDSHSEKGLEWFLDKRSVCKGIIE